MVRFASSIGNQEIDPELENYFHNQFVANYLRSRRFKTSNGLIDDEFMCFRALSDQVYGDQKYFFDILTELCQYLGIYEVTINQKVENFGRFQECKILKAFSFIYECKINVHQIDREPIAICERARSTREINILFLNGRYSSLIKDLYY